MKSVFCDEPVCYICQRSTNVQHHIIEGNGRRPISERLGLKVYLCPPHHNMSDAGVHFNKELDLQLKRMAQEYYEEHYGTREDFIKDFIQSYL